MKLFKIFLVTALLLYTVSASLAQCDTLPIKIPERVFVNTNEFNLLYGQMLDSLLFLMKSEYVLVTNNTVKPNQYGRFGNTYFGRQFSVAVLANGKLWFNQSCTKPWRNELDIQAYGDSLKPNLSLLAFRSLNDIRFIPIDFDNIQITGYQLSALPFLNEHGAGNWWQQDTTPSSGRLVLLCNIADDNNKNLTIQKYFYKISPHWIGNEAIISKPAFAKGECIGGAFFYEKLTAGSLQLWLGGIIETIDNTTLKLTKINEQQEINTDSVGSTNR